MQMQLPQALKSEGQSGCFEKKQQHFLHSDFCLLMKVHKTTMQNQKLAVYKNRSQKMSLSYKNV